MRARVSLGICALFVSIFAFAAAQAQQNIPAAPTPNNGDPIVEGTVVSSTHHTLVVRSDDNQYHLFTYDDNKVRDSKAQPGSRVRVNAGPPDDEGAAVATNVSVLDAASGNTGGSDGSSAGNAGQGVHAAPPPPQVTHVENEIESEARRWHAGGRIGVGFSPEVFLFGVQSQIGPIFTRRLVFRPNADFAFGELTDMASLNLEAAYRFNTTFRGGWTPYFGLGPSLNFAHQGFSHSDVSFGNFDYKTGFNVLLGAQKRHTFLEMKTSLWSGPAPVLRLIVGYNF
jgi:hypothetical protein